MEHSFNEILCNFCGRGSTDVPHFIISPVREKNGARLPPFLECLLPKAGICSSCLAEIKTRLEPMSERPERADIYCHLCGETAASLDKVFVGRMLSVCDKCICVSYEILEEGKSDSS